MRLYGLPTALCPPRRGLLSSIDALQRLASSSSWLAPHAPVSQRRERRSAGIALCLFCSLLASLLSVRPVRGQEKSQKAQQSPQNANKPKKGRTERPPDVERITDTLYRVGKVIVDLQARTVTCPGKVNMDSGAIEYLAVAPGGKTHESLLEVEVRPLHLQVALLLLNLQPKNVLKSQGDPATPQGAPVDLFIRWRDAHGVEQEVRAEEWVAEMPAGKPMSTHAWVYTGSKIVAEGFVADLEKSLVAVWHDPAAILDNPRSTGGDNAHIVNTRLTGAKQVPKRGTSITFVVKAL